MYRFRLGITVLSLAFVLLCVASISLLPALFLVSVKEERLALDLSLKGEEITPNAHKDTEILIGETQKQMSILRKGGGTEVSEAIIDILETKGDAITPIGFFFQKSSSDKTQEDKLVLRGKSATRSSLLSFVGELKKNARFKSVDLPVSDLVQSSDITFSITVGINRSKKE